MENQYYAEPFFVKDNSLFMNKLIKGRETEVKLCNFTARIVEDITCTNGADNERFLSIVGTDENGNHLRKITVPLKNFSQLDWAQEYWSMNCVVEAGYGNRDNLRQAIQSTAKFAEAKTIYGTTGWWETSTGWQFCMPGNSNTEVELTEKTKGYSFKTDSDITQTMTVMKNFPYSVAPKEIMFPMLSYTLVSILGTFMAKAGKETKTVIKRNTVRKVQSRLEKSEENGVSVRMIFSKWDSAHLMILMLNSNIDVRGAKASLKYFFRRTK